MRFFIVFFRRYHRLHCSHWPVQRVVLTRQWIGGLCYWVLDACHFGIDTARFQTIICRLIANIIEDNAVPKWLNGPKVVCQCLAIFVLQSPKWF